MSSAPVVIDTLMVKIHTDVSSFKFCRCQLTLLLLMKLNISTKQYYKKFELCNCNLIVYLDGRGSVGGVGRG